MTANFQLLTRALLLVAIPALVATAPKSSASIDLVQNKQAKTQPTKTQLTKTQHNSPSDSTRYLRLRLKNGSIAHVVVVDMPSKHWKLRTVVNARPLNVAYTALNYGASIAVNGGFFDLRSGKSVGYVSDQTHLIADPHEANKGFSVAILGRSELRQIVDDAGVLQLVVARHNEPLAKGTHVEEALQAGPALLPSYEPVAEAFIRKTRRGGQIDAISTASPEARTALGITSDGKLIIVCVETPGRKPDGHGATLKQLATILKGLGAVQALNLDGGTSTTMYVRLPNSASSVHGKVVCGATSMRAVKSVLLLQYVR